MQAVDLATVLECKYNNNDKQYKHQLVYGKDKIIESCGGLHHLLQLYLSNTIDEQAVNKLHAFLNTTDINTQNRATHHQLMQQYTSTNLQEINTRKCIVPTVRAQRLLFVPEILEVDECDTLYLRLLKSRSTANWFYNHVVKSKYMKAMVVLCLLLAVLTMCLVLAFDYSYITWYIWSYGISWVLVAYALLHILGLNVELIKATMKTFDFGYKMCQLVILVITLPPILLHPANDHSAYDAVNYNTLAIVGIVFICCIDATSMHTKFKLIVLSVVIVLISSLPFYIYFFFEDVLWDPFDGAFGPKITQISFKSSLLNALMNSILMFLKPFGVGLISYIQERKGSNNNSLVKKGFVKSVGMLNRPFIRWIKYNDNVSDQDVMVQAPVNTTSTHGQTDDDEADEIKMKPFTVLTQESDDDTSTSHSLN